VAGPAMVAAAAAAAAWRTCLHVSQRGQCLHGASQQQKHLSIAAVLPSPLMQLAQGWQVHGCTTSHHQVQRTHHQLMQPNTQPPSLLTCRLAVCVGLCAYTGIVPVRIPPPRGTRAYTDSTHLSIHPLHSLTHTPPT
jgi:hypothetical protein